MDDVQARAKAEMGDIDVSERTIRRALERTQPESAVKTLWFLPYQRAEACEQLLRMLPVSVISLDMCVHSVER